MLFFIYFKHTSLCRLLLIKLYNNLRI